LDIVLYTTEETLAHKKSRDYDEYYWQMSRLPKNLKKGDRIYFITKKKIQGSFKIEKVTDIDIIWKPTTWRLANKKIVVKPFRGFRYRWWRNR